MNSAIPSPVPVHLVAEGREDGPVVLFSGSLGSDLRMWDPQVAPLVAAGYRVVRYDHRGHGRSPIVDGAYTIDELAIDALDVLDRVGAEDAHIVGLSLGGMIAMWLGRHAPARIRTLTLCCTSVDLGGAGTYGARATSVRTNGTDSVASAVVQRWFTPGWIAENPGDADYYRGMVASTSVAGYAGCCEAIEEFDFGDDLASIAAPTLVIAGANDTATPPEHGARIAETVAAGRLRVIESAAHLANVEQPARLGAAVVEHLAAAGIRR